MNFLEKVQQTPNALRGYLFGDPQRNGEYRFLYKLLKRLSHKSLVIFDVGAHVGDYTKAILSGHPNVNVYCFEPSPKAFEHLRKNLASHQNVVLEKKALSSEQGLAEFIIYGELDQRNSIEKHTDVSAGNYNKEVVNVDTVDEYCRRGNITNIDFIKIDVEGHELKVLQGARNMIRNRGIHVIQFEYNTLWKGTANTLREMFSELAGYRIYRLTPWGKIRTRNYTKSIEVYPTASNYVAIL